MSRLSLVALLVALWACSAAAFLLPAPAQRSSGRLVVMKAESSDTVRPTAR